MRLEPDPTVTTLLEGMQAGDPDAESAVWEAVYDELHAIAAAMMTSEQPGHDIQATALVHEAYVRLIGGQPLDRPVRAYFFGAASQAMRRILIEQGRQRAGRLEKMKRVRISVDTLEDEVGGLLREDPDCLQPALDELEATHRAVFDLVMLRFFCGFSIEETAKILHISQRAVKRLWEFGRTWL